MNHDHLIYVFGRAIGMIPEGFAGIGIPLQGGGSIVYYRSFKLNFSDEDLASAEVSVFLPGLSGREPVVGSRLVDELRSFVEPVEYPSDAIPYGLVDRPRSASKRSSLPPIPPIGGIPLVDPKPIAKPDPVIEPILPILSEPAKPQPISGVQIYLWGAPPLDPAKRGRSRSR